MELESSPESPPVQGNRVTAELRQSLHAISEVENSLCVGETLLVQGKLRTQPFKVSLAGWVAGEMVLVAPSIAVLAAGQIVKEEFLLVRYLFLGKVYGFETTALKIVLDPPLVILEWPDVVEVAAVSRELRSQAKMPVEVTFYEDGQAIGTGPAILTELSPGGCRVKTVWQNEYMASYVPDSSLLVQITIGPNQGSMVMRCTVRNFSRQNNYAVLGLQISDDVEIKNQINNILAMQLIR